jgi:LEA14-like dessication related protein
LENEDAIKTLRNRYTKGEISRKEYLQMKKDLDNDKKNTKNPKASHLVRNLAIFIVILIIAVFLYQTAQANAFKSVQVNLADGTIANAGLTSATLNLDLSMYNPSSIPATLQSITYSIYWNNNVVGSGTISEPVSIPSHQSVIEPTTLTISYAEALSSLFSSISTKNLSLSIDGDATYGSIFGPITSGFSIPIDFKSNSSNPGSNYQNSSNSQQTTSASTTIQYTNTCIAQSGYGCLDPVLSASTGNLSVGIGQNTGTNWTYADIVFVPQGTPISDGLPVVSFSPPQAAYGALASGVFYNVTLPATSPHIANGTNLSGTIWAKYYLKGSNVAQYVQMAIGEFTSN